MLGNEKWQERQGSTEEEMDGRGGGDNVSATTRVKGSSPR